MPASTARVMKASQCLLNMEIMTTAARGIALAPEYNAKMDIALSVVTWVGNIKDGFSIPTTEKPVATNTFKTVMTFKKVNAFISYCL